MQNGKAELSLWFQTISSTNLAVFSADSTSRPAYAPSANTRAIRGKRSFIRFEQGLTAIAVLHIGARDRYGEDQTQYIDHNVPLTTLGVFTGIVAPIAPFA